MVVFSRHLALCVAMSAAGRTMAVPMVPSLDVQDFIAQQLQEILEKDTSADYISKLGTVVPALQRCGLLEPRDASVQEVLKQIVHPQGLKCIFHSVKAPKTSTEQVVDFLQSRNFFSVEEARTLFKVPLLDDTTRLTKIAATRLGNPEDELSTEEFVRKVMGFENGDTAREVAAEFIQRMQKLDSRNLRRKEVQANVPKTIVVKKLRILQHQGPEASGRPAPLSASLSPVPLPHTDNNKPITVQLPTAPLPLVSVFGSHTADSPLNHGGLPEYFTGLDSNGLYSSGREGPYVLPDVDAERSNMPAGFGTPYLRRVAEAVSHLNFLPPIFTPLGGSR